MSHKKRQEQKKYKRKQANREQQRRRDARRESSAPPSRKPLSFFSMSAPFSSLPLDQALTAFQDTGRHWACRFDELLPKLESLILQTNPLALLAMASAITLMRPVDALIELAEEGRYFSSHLELLQAFVLRQSADKFAPRFVDPQHLTEVMDCVRDLSRSFAFKRMSQVSPEMPQAQRGAMAVSEQFRVHTQDVRNEGYIGQMHRIYTDLLAPLDADFVAAFGVTARGIVDCFFHMLGMVRDRFNAHIKKCEGALTAQMPEEAVDQYAAAYDLTPVQRSALSDFINRNGLADEDLRAYLIWQMLNGIHRLFTWSIDDWMPFLGPDANEDSVIALIDRLSLKPEALSEINPEHLFMGNPVWVQPLIPLDERHFFLACPGAPLSHCLEIITFLIDDEPELKTKYLKRRGEFLENELYKLIRKSMPNAELFPGSIWRSADGSEGENDLLVVLNGVALVFEAKAGTIHASAKRGATLRLQDTVGKLVVDASTQAQGFIKFLKEAKGSLSLPSSRGGHNEIDVSKIDSFVPIAISLDQLPSEYLCWSILAKTGTVPADAEPVVAMSLWDLELVTEILDDECLLLHYLSRRYMIEQHANYFGDELDLLVLYLDTGLDIPPGTSESPLQLGHLSTQLNPYFIGKEAGIKTEKPARRLTPWWRKLVTAIWSKQSKESREAAFALLDVAIQQQEEIGREFEKTKRHVQSNATNATIQDCIVFELGSGEFRYCIVLIAVGDSLFTKPKQDLHDYMSATAWEALSESPTCEYAMVFAVHADLQSLPYSSFALIHRDGWTKEPTPAAGLSFQD